MKPAGPAILRERPVDSHKYWCSTCKAHHDYNGQEEIRVISPKLPILREDNKITNISELDKFNEQFPKYHVDTVYEEDGIDVSIKMLWLLVNISIGMALIIYYIIISNL